jgi:hypothetical protein
MKGKPKQQAEPFDVERFRKELGLKLQRLAAESIEAWPTCDNVQCRRAKRCASQKRECVAKWRESLPPISPEEAEARMADFRIEIEVRNRLGGESVTAAQFAEAVRKEKAARRAAMPPQAAVAPGPVAAETQLAPETAEPIDRACNDHVASWPGEKAEATEDAGPAAREPGPRITQL